MLKIKLDRSNFFFFNKGIELTPLKKDDIEKEKTKKKKYFLHILYTLTLSHEFGSIPCERVSV
jgi:hypothetical protein